MATFIATVKTVSVGYDDEGTARTRVVLVSTGEAEEHVIADALASMHGTRVKVSVILEQPELPE